MTKNRSELQKIEKIPFETPRQKLPKMSETDLADRFVLKSNSEHTKRTYRAHLNEFLEFAELCNGRPVRYSEATFEDVTKWRDFLQKEGKSENTIRTKIAAIRSLFEFGRALGVFEHNPASSKLVPPPKKPRHSLKGRALTNIEVKTLLSWFRLDALIGARNYAMLLIMLRTSLRVSEVTNLKVSDIKYKSNRWTIIVSVKGGERDIRPLPTDVKKAIDKYLELDRKNREMLKTQNSDAYVFQAEPQQRYFGKNLPLSTRQVWHIVKETGKLSGIGKATPHDLRRTAITTAFQLNIPIIEIQRMSGHKDLNTLQIYNLDRENLEANAINKLSYD